MLNRTALGRYTFAIGSNEEAVRLSGVNVDRWKIIIYSLGGAICGVAGLLIASRINSAQPALGQGYELDAIAAVVIGGTSLSGGTGTILGTIIGAFIMSVLTNGLRIMSVAQEWQFVVTGVIIILAVYADMLRRSADNEGGLSSGRSADFDLKDRRRTRIWAANASNQSNVNLTGGNTTLMSNNRLFGVALGAARSVALGRRARRRSLYSRSSPKASSTSSGRP